MNFRATILKEFCGRISWFLYLMLVLILNLAISVSSDAETSRTIGGNFSLTAHDGSRFELSSLHGRIVLIYFGFTNCPSICPMELSNIGRAMNALPNLEISGVFITVDPDRDTVDKLAVYVPYFHPNIVGLSGSDDEIRNVADQYNVRYKRVSQGSSYTVDHSSHIFILDHKGTIRALAPFGSSVEHLVNLIQGIAGTSTD